MRWVIPAAVVATVVGLLLLYPPLGLAAALILPPQAPFALILAGTVGIVVGVTGAWRSRSSQAGGVGPSGGTRLSVATPRVADAAALAGLVVALAALLALSLVYIVEPILASPQGPDPCHGRYDPACFAAHPEYWQPFDGGYGWSNPGSRSSQSLTPFWLVALPLALGAVLISWLALAKGTGRRRTAFSALTLASLVVVGMVVGYVGLLLSGGG